MTKALVVYYSRTGHTRSVAMELAARCEADVEEIRDAVTKRTGVFGYLRCGREALGKQIPPIEPATATPANYDVVILGTPVWAGHIASPVRSYLQAHAAETRHIAMFCTQGGNGGTKVMAEIAELCGKHALATLVLNERDVTRARYAEPLDEFVAAIPKQLSPPLAVTRDALWHTAATSGTAWRQQ